MAKKSVSVFEVPNETSVSVFDFEPELELQREEPLVDPNPGPTIDRARSVFGMSQDFELPTNLVDPHYPFLRKPTVIGESRPLSTFTEPGKQTGSVTGALATGGLRIARAMADFGRRFLYAGNNITSTVLPPIAGQPGVIDLPGVTRGIREPVDNPAYRAAKNFNAKVNVAIDEIFTQHPEWQNDPPESFLKALENPERTALSILEAVPLLAAAGFSIVLGSPSGAMALMYSSESDAAKRNFIAKGATDEVLIEAGSNLYGLGATAIEFLQVKQGLKLVGEMRNVVLNRTARKLAALGGRSITKGMAINAAMQSVEEIGQGRWEDIVGLVILDQPIEGGLRGMIDRSAREALFASVLSLATGGVGIVAGGVQQAISPKQVSKFTEIIDSKQSELEKAYSEGRLEDAEEILNDAVLESTGTDPRLVEQQVAQEFAEIDQAELSEVETAKQALDEALKPIPAIREGATQADIESIESQVAQKPQAIKDAAENLQKAQADVIARSEDILSQAIARIQATNQNDADIATQEQAIQDANELLAELGKPIVAITEGAVQATPESVRAELVDRNARTEEVKAKLQEVQSQLEVARATAENLDENTISIEQAQDSIDDVIRLLDAVQGITKTVVTPREPETPAKAITPAKPPVTPKKPAETPAAEVIPERDILGGVDPIFQISKALKAARAVRPLTEAQKRKTLRKRVAAASKALAKNIAGGEEARIAGFDPAEEAIIRSTGLLKGPLATYDQVFEPIRDILNEANPGLTNDIFKQIGTDSERLPQYFQKQDMTQAFRKLIDGNSLTFREADLLGNYFGTDIAVEAQERIGQNSIADKLITLWRAGLLTGIKTSGLNTFSNLSHGLTETAKDVPAVAIDIAASLFTGKRTIGLTARGVPSGMVQGAKLGWNYMKTGHDERNIGAKLDFKRVNFGTSKFGRALQAYEETIFHLMGAEDQPFYYGAKSRSLYSQAIAQAKNAKVKGAARETFIQNLLDGPRQKTIDELRSEGLITDDTPETSFAEIQEEEFDNQQDNFDTMLKYAVHDAEVAVYQNRTKIGDIAAAIHKSGNLGKIVVPFSRTPAAVGMQIVNYSPIGVTSEIFKQVGNGVFDQRAFSHAFGRSAIGTAPLALGAALFRAGLVTLDRPDSEREKELQLAEGRKPNSIRINGKWRSPDVLGPVGDLILWGAYFDKNFQETGSLVEAVSVTAAGGAKSFSEKTFIVGANRAMKAISDPENFFNVYFSSLVGSTVPTLIGDIARATDDVERRSTGPKEKFLSRIPGQRQKLEPQIDAYGQDLPRYGGNSLEIMLDPTRPAVVRRDLVVDEIRRLWDLDIKVAPTKIGDRKGFKILTPEENTVLWRRSGELVHTALFGVITSKKGDIDPSTGEKRTTGYDDLEDEDKGKLIEAFVKQGKDVARTEAAQHKLSQGVTMEELRLDGLVTSDVRRLLGTEGAAK